MSTQTPSILYYFGRYVVVGLYDRILRSLAKTPAPKPKPIIVRKLTISSMRLHAYFGAQTAGYALANDARMAPMCRIP
jgi:hypothetical protein